MAAGFRRGAVFFLAVIVLFPSVAQAQLIASFDQLPTRVRDGDTVYVVDDQGRETRGRVVLVSGSSLALLVEGNRRDFSPATLNAIWRRGDSILNGLAIGAIGGFMAGGFLGGRNPGEEGSFFPAGGVLGCLIGVGLGAAVDAVIPGKRLVYRAPPGSLSGRIVVSPVFLRAGVGVSASARW